VPAGHSKAEKAETHRRIVAIASKRFREDGLAGIGIAELISAGEPFVPDERRRDDLGITRHKLGILELVAQGMSKREITENLYVSENTVKTHSSRVFDKLGPSDGHGRSNSARDSVCFPELLTRTNDFSSRSPKSPERMTTETLPDEL
jgi:DNA-binding NarL/FixJ family response regulator